MTKDNNNYSKEDYFLKKILLTVLSLFIFSFVVLLCGVWFLYVKTIFSMVVLTIMMILLFFWYSHCAKVVTLPEGYTVFQALIFYQSCVKIGVNCLDDAKTNHELLKDISEEQGITDLSSVEDLWKLYCVGQEIILYIRRKSK